jgi:hypothetical protein
VIGPLWDVGQGVQRSSLVGPPFAGAAIIAYVSPLWQMISGLAYAAGVTKPLSKSVGVF